jgi:hypothetical protein
MVIEEMNTHHRAALAKLTFDWPALTAATFEELADYSHPPLTLVTTFGELRPAIRRFRLAVARADVTAARAVSFRTDGRNGANDLEQTFFIEKLPLDRIRIFAREAGILRFAHAAEETGGALRVFDGATGEPVEDLGPLDRATILTLHHRFVRGSGGAADLELRAWDRAISVRSNSATYPRYLALKAAAARLGVELDKAVAKVETYLGLTVFGSNAWFDDDEEEIEDATILGSDEDEEEEEI